MAKYMQGIGQRHSPPRREMEEHLLVTKDRLSRMVPHQDFQSPHWFIIVEEIPVGANAVGRSRVNPLVSVVLYVENV